MRDAIENAAVGLLPQRAFLRSRAIAEQPLKRLPRIDGHRQRLRGRRPTDGVRVHASIAVIAMRPMSPRSQCTAESTAAAYPGRTAARTSDRWRCRSEYRRPRSSWDAPRSGTRSWTGNDRRPLRRRANAPAGRRSVSLMMVRYSRNGSSGFSVCGKLEIRALFFRRPVMLVRPVHRAARRAVHHFDAAQPRTRRRGGLGERRLRRHHRIQKRQRQRTPMPRKTVRRERCFLVMNIMALFPSSLNPRRRRLPLGNRLRPPSASGTACCSRYPKRTRKNGCRLCAASLFDRAHHRHIAIIHHAAQPIRQQTSP